MTSVHMRYQGCLLGLAVGDALGTTLEFKPPGSFTPITDITGGGPFRLKPGQWTSEREAMRGSRNSLGCDNIPKGLRCVG